MNFFDGQIRENGGEMVFEEGKLVNTKAVGGGAGSNGNGNGHGPQVKVGELTMPGGGFTLSVPPNLREVMRKSLNRHVVLGIRPEHFHLRDPGYASGATAAVKMVLNVIEPLGNDMDVYMHTRLHDHVVGRVEAQAGLQRDSEQMMFVDLRKIHFFEPGETGMNLSLKSEPAHALA
jgi:ABC-type sugar transport system ATPase subunit